MASFYQNCRNVHHIEILRKKYAIGDVGTYKSEAVEIVSDLGVDEGSIQAVVRKLIDAEIDALTALEIGEGAMVSTPSMVSPVPAGETTNTTTEPTGPLLSKCVASWIEEKKEADSWTSKTTEERQSTLEAFKEICGNRPIDDYVKADGREFIRIIKELPPNYQKILAFKGKKLKAIAKKANSECLGKPTNQTINKKIAGVSAFFTWLEAKYDEAPKNPINGLKF